MAQIEYIKHLYEVEGKSISYIAKTLQLNRRTVTKYAEKYNWTPLEKPLEERRYPVLGMFSSMTFIRYTFIEKLKISLTYKALLVGISTLIIGYFIYFLLNVILPKQFNIEESEGESFN